MSAEVHGERACEVSLEEAEAELERLLADGRFRVSDRQRDILRYLAERRFAGCTEGVKAYSIALDVLGRSSNFDASIDPIVRIEISRLRAALDGYYAAFGAELGVSVHIPKGSYVALFPQAAVGGRAQTAPTQLAHHPESTLADGGPDAVAVSLPRFAISWRWMPAVLCVGLLALAGIVGWKAIDRPVVTLKPAVTILMSAASPDMAGEASVARDTLLTALSAFDTIVVTRPGSPTQPARRGYEVDLKYYADSDDRSVWWQVVDTASGTLLKSGLERVETEGKEPATIRLEIAGAVARQIASSRGVINALEAREAPADALGNACVARAEFMLDGSESGGGVDGLRGCLERTLAGDPEDPDTSAMLARLYARDTATIPQALEMAKSAVSTAPLSDRAQGALMAARFASGRLDAAIDAGNRAMALNPNNSANAASLSLVLFAAGYFKAANDLAREAVAMEETPPRDASLVLALDAYRNARWSEASLAAEQAVGNDMLTRTIRVAALGELGADSAGQRLGEAATDRAAFIAAFRQAAKMAQLRPELVTSLETGLGKAGASLEAVASISGQ
ncbi:tetratricopeptide repeat protein [Rhizobium sp. 16-449-1b]|uniref:tetratricopeptide repeat protein n=1 Tax=Rhizobium sp. 16-449-1b TaxID=2819989 RepID=UPI001ADA5683|nr:tetratricopeptide repeat protein [Rhizobium sp. 16-449-1b]MBO9196636.1 tetratricopeptide repeat protein [Rhizobium sp. 16-449-1b]